MLDRTGISPRALARVVCGAGPGSFTSLRIAASIAKGLALGAACPMFAVSSLALIVAAGEARPGRYLAELDALRGEAYVGAYALDSSGVISTLLSDRLVLQSDVSALADHLRAVTIGIGQKIEGAPHARGVLALEAVMLRSRPVDLGSWEPDYGRKAEAQARWETVHGQVLAVDPSSV
jgi:tRNA threonylcarbamoyladenosine biosynthesis protein TsaB